MLGRPSLFLGLRECLHVAAVAELDPWVYGDARNAHEWRSLNFRFNHNIGMIRKALPQPKIKDPSVSGSMKAYCSFVQYCSSWTTSGPSPSSSAFRSLPHSDWLRQSLNALHSLPNRFEPASDLVDLGIVEAIGAEIGAAILAEFPAPEPSAAVDPSRLGIGGPRRP